MTIKVKFLGRIVIGNNAILFVSIQPLKNVCPFLAHVERLTLVYSSFNGVYIKDPVRTHQGRPVYVEQKKYDRTPFDEITPAYYPVYAYSAIEIDPVKPAEIKFCGDSWVLNHPFIQKSRKNKTESCTWLLRSPETASYNLLDVDGRWDIWTGVIHETDVSIKCNKCSEDSDCNLNGVCNSTGACECDADDNAVYLGTHCEVKLRDECRTIIGELYNETWTVGSPVTYLDEMGSRNGDVIDQEYSRPIYSYVDGLPEDQAPDDFGSFGLIYSGSRYTRVSLPQVEDESASEYWIWQITNYHSFWSRAYEPGVTDVVSAITSGDTPVNADFFRIGEHGLHYGAFGQLFPLQGQTSGGYYRCQPLKCKFCTSGITTDENVVRPELNNASCRSVALNAESLDLERINGHGQSSMCEEIQVMEQICCPTTANDEL